MKVIYGHTSGNVVPLPALRAQVGEAERGTSESLRPLPRNKLGQAGGNCAARSAEEEGSEEGRKGEVRILAAELLDRNRNSRGCGLPSASPARNSTRRPSCSSKTAPTPKPLQLLQSLLQTPNECDEGDLDAGMSSSAFRMTLATSLVMRSSRLPPTRDFDHDGVSAPVF
jgi:hypothetical protein